MKLSENINDMILVVIDTLGYIYGRTYIQKLFFLIENELFKNINLNYIKYRYGPFSRTLRNEIENLNRTNLLNESTNTFNGHEGHCFQLSFKGKNEVKKIKQKYLDSEIMKLIEFCRKFQNYSPSDILRYVYAEYPQWTENSVLNND